MLKKLKNVDGKEVIFFIVGLGAIGGFITMVVLLTGNCHKKTDNSHKVIDGNCYKRIEESSGTHGRKQISYIPVDMLYCN